MTYTEFEGAFQDYLQSVPNAQRRKWKLRQSVPKSAIEAAKAFQNSKEGVPSVPKSPSSVPKSRNRSKAHYNVNGVAVNVCAGLTVTTPSYEVGHPEWDFMSDGFARGFAGDDLHMRKAYRTPAAIHREADAKGVPFKQLLRERGFDALPEKVL